MPSNNACPKTLFLSIFFWRGVLLLYVCVLKQKRGCLMHERLQKFVVIYLPHSGFTRQCCSVCCFPTLLGVCNSIDVISVTIVVGLVVENSDKIFSLELSSILFYVSMQGYVRLTSPQPWLFCRVIHSDSLLLNFKGYVGNWTEEKLVFTVVGPLIRQCLVSKQWWPSEHTSWISFLQTSCTYLEHLTAKLHDWVFKLVWNAEGVWGYVLFSPYCLYNKTPEQAPPPFFKRFEMCSHAIFTVSYTVNLPNEDKWKQWMHAYSMKYLIGSTGVHPLFLVTILPPSWILFRDQARAPLPILVWFFFTVGWALALYFTVCISRFSQNEVVVPLAFFLACVCTAALLQV